MVGCARTSPWQFRKADFQMGHILELASITSLTTETAFCDSEYYHRTRIEGCFEGHSPEHLAGTPSNERLRDLRREKTKRWDRASTAPNKTRLSPCLPGPSFGYCGLEQPQAQLGGFSRP